MRISYQRHNAELVSQLADKTRELHRLCRLVRRMKRTKHQLQKNLHQALDALKVEQELTDYLLAKLNSER